MVQTCTALRYTVIRSSPTLLNSLVAAGATVMWFVFITLSDRYGLKRGNQR